MQGALILALCLVPAPRDAAPFPVGEWQAEWGSIRQQMIFHADGSYSSKEFGGGYWSTDGDGNIWFSEREDSTHYSMWLDSKTHTGTGWTHHREDGTYWNEVKVKLRRPGR